MPPSKKLTCIIIDDDSILRNLLESMLKRTGFEILGTSAFAHEGMLLCEELHPSLVLLDINLPESNGLEILPQILRLMPTPKVVMVTGEATMERVKESLQAGASGFVVKPFTQGRLFDAVSRALGTKLQA